jgi:hypothetical protein
MRHRFLLSLTCLMLSLVAITQAQLTCPNAEPPYCLRFVKISGSTTQFVFKVQIMVKTGSWAQTFPVGNSNFYFTVSSEVDRSRSVLTPMNFSGGLYFPMTITSDVSNGTPLHVLNIEYALQGLNPAMATTISQSAWTDVATVTLYPFGSSTFTGNAGLSWVVVHYNPPTTTSCLRYTQLWDASDFQPTISSLHYPGDTYPALSQDCLYPFDQPLPVELVSLTARWQESSRVHLAWRTASEMNNFGFEVERSLLNGPWVKVGFVDGHGTCNISQTYDFFDSEPILARTTSIRYRLHQVDRDGAAEYSSIVEVKNESPLMDLGLTLSPMPANSEAIATVTLPQSSNVTLRVYNALGKMVLSARDTEPAEAGSHAYPLNVSSLTSGTYYVVAETSEGRIVRSLLVR